MHRFFLPPDQCNGDSLTLEGAEAHHALRVLRLRVDACVTILNGQGLELRCRVSQAGRQEVRVTVTEQRSHPAPSCRITLLQAIPKGRLMDSIIQKAVELGVSRIVPLLSERVVADPGEEGAARKTDKWRQTAIEAIKQCGNPWLPTIEAPVTPTEFLRRVMPPGFANVPSDHDSLPKQDAQKIFRNRPAASPSPEGEGRPALRSAFDEGGGEGERLLPQGDSFDINFIASLQPGSKLMGEHFAALRARQPELDPASAAIWIGPEGDFSATEIEAVTKAGALPITLGPLVLRSETAAICALSILSHELQILQSVKSGKHSRG